jgi:hypothetical protein
MTSKKVALLLLASSLVTIASLAAREQTRDRSERGLDPGAFYERVVDIKFQVPPQKPTDRLRVILRFTPPSGPESQIAITEDIYDHPIVLEYDLPPDSKAIWEQLPSLRDESKLDDQDPALIANKIKVNIRTVNIPSSVINDLLRGLAELRFPSIGIDPRQTNAVHDGGRIDFWLEEFLSGQVHVGCKYNPRDNNATALVNWMMRTRKIVDSAK